MDKKITPKTEFLHAGYFLILDEKSLDLFNKWNKPTLTTTKGKNNPKVIETSVFLALKEKPYTCIVYPQNGKSENVSAWFMSKKNDGNEHFFFLRNLIVDYKQGVMVGEGTIDGEPTYITLTKQEYNNLRPIEIKKTINKGKLGTKIPLEEPLKIKVMPCAFIQGKGYRDQIMIV